MHTAYTKFEKQHGVRSTLESTVLGKRRIQYEDELANDRHNYDVWLDYCRLEEDAFRDLRAEGATPDEHQQAVVRAREVYEQAVSQVPPADEKRHWRRYIFLWLNYALFEETEIKVRFSFGGVPFLFVDSPMIGLRSDERDIPDGGKFGAAQAVHVRETVDHVC